MMNYEMKSADTFSNHCYEVHPQSIFPVEKSIEDMDLAARSNIALLNPQNPIIDPIQKKRKMKIKETSLFHVGKI